VVRECRKCLRLRGWGNAQGGGWCGKHRGGRGLNCSCFQVLRVIQPQAPSHDGTQLSEVRGAAKWMSSPMPACHAGGVTVVPNPHTGFKTCQPVLLLGLPGLPCGCGFLPRLHSPVWGGAVGTFLLFSPWPFLLFSMTFQQSFCLFRDSRFSSSLCLCSSLSFVTLTLLVHGVTWRKLLVHHLQEEGFGLTLKEGLKIIKE
jgi:hypothetical protein